MFFCVLLISSSIAAIFSVSPISNQIDESSEGKSRVEFEKTKILRFLHFAFVGFGEDHSERSRMARLMIFDSDEEIERQLAESTTKRNLDPTLAVTQPQPSAMGPSDIRKQSASIGSVSAPPAVVSPLREQRSTLAQFVSAKTVRQQARRIENVFEGLARFEKSENQSEKETGCENGIDEDSESTRGAAAGTPGWKGKGRQMDVEVTVDKDGKSWTVFVLDDEDSDDGMPAPRLNARPARPLSNSPSKPLANSRLFAGVSNALKTIKVPAALQPIGSRTWAAANAHASTSKQTAPISPVRGVAVDPDRFPTPTQPLPTTAASDPLPPISQDSPVSLPVAPPALPVVPPAKAQGPITPTRPRRVTGNYEEGAQKVDGKAAFFLAARANGLKASVSPVRLSPAKTSPIAQRVRKKRIAAKITKEIVAKKVSGKGKGKRKAKGTQFERSKKKARVDRNVNPITDKKLKQELKKVVKLVEPLSEAEHAIALEKYLAREKSKAPWARSIAGPSFEGEFNAELQNHLFKTRKGGVQSLPGDTVRRPFRWSLSVAILTCLDSSSSSNL